MKTYALVFSLTLLTSLNGHAEAFLCNTARKIPDCTHQTLRLVVDTDREEYQLILQSRLALRFGQCEDSRLSRYEESSGRLETAIGGFMLENSQSLFKLAYLEMDGSTPAALSLIDRGEGQRLQRHKLDCTRLGGN